jgi:signal transduction histidine kinase
MPERVSWSGEAIFFPNERLLCRERGMTMSQGTNEQGKWEEVEETLRKARSFTASAQYAAVVMHDISNPLETATNLVYLINDAAEDPLRVRQYALLLEEQLANVSQIAQRSLNFYRSDGVMKSTDLVAVAGAALRVHEHKIVARALRLQKILPQDAFVEAHPGEMLQVLTNLIANALDALPVDGSISIRIRKDANEAHIMIVDNGHGIPESLLSKIFEPFFTTKEDRGTGLGLAISKSIIERHLGRIRTRSCVRPGRSGTAFRISLPLARTASVDAT